METKVDPRDSFVYQSESANYSWIVNDLIQVALKSRIDDPRNFPRWVDSIEISISFTFLDEKKKTQFQIDLEGCNKDLDNCLKKFKLREDKEKNDVKRLEITEERDQELLGLYDTKLDLLIKLYNEWVQLFKKPIRRSISTVWTGQ